MRRLSKSYKEMHRLCASYLILRLYLIRVISYILFERHLYHPKIKFGAR